MKKYYIEIYPRDKDIENRTSDGYLIQSCWFEKEEDVIKWADLIDYKDKTCDIWLMYSEWDNQHNCPIDIKLKKFLK